MPDKFKTAVAKVQKHSQKNRKGWKDATEGLSRSSLISLPPAPKSSSEDSDDKLAIKNVTRKSSANLGKFPTLTEEEITFFRLVQEGDSVGLKDFMKSPSYAKIQINKTDKFGFSALHYAVRRQDEEMVTIFLEQEGILTYDTIFHAIQEENVEITKMLLEVQDKQSPPSVPLGGVAATHFFMPNNPPPFFKIYGVPRVLSPTKINSQQDLQDWEKFDSEFPIHSTELMLAARKGNYALMEMFYQRGQRLETLEYDHNCGCKCRICVRTDRKLSSESEQLSLFEALTNPKYICFIAGKTKTHDPVNYAVFKILKCRELEDKESMFKGQFSEYETKLTGFLKDLVEELKSNEESETFFRVPDPSTEGRLRRKYPRMWTMIGLNQVDIVTHPHAQYIVQKEWDITSHTMPGFFLPLIYTILELLVRVVCLPFVAVILYVTDCPCPCSTCCSGVNTCLQFLRTPRSRYRNWVASYIIFLAFLTMQVIISQRCHEDKAWYWFFVVWDLNWKPDEMCSQRGNPTIGTEWFLIIYVLGIFSSMLKRNSIPWYYKSPWTWYEMVTQLCFLTTFAFWGWANYEKKEINSKLKPNQHPIVEPRDAWGQLYPEVLAQMSLSVSCILAWGYVLRLIQIERHIGPLQIAVGKMMSHFLLTAFVYSIVLFSFSSGLNAIYIPYNTLIGHVNSKLVGPQSSPFGSALHAPQELFWSLYGMSASDKTHIVRFSQTLTNGTEISHHPIWSERAGRTLFQFFHILGVLMMFNMLVAFFTQAAEEVLENADKQWKFTRTEIHMIYLKDTMLPPPFNLIPSVSSFCRFFKYIGWRCIPVCCSSDEPRGKRACSWRQCCYIQEPVDRGAELQQKRAYRRLILELIHRYSGKDTERANQTPATSDDVKEIGEELAELKSQIQSKMREMQTQILMNTTTQSKPKKKEDPGAAGGATKTEEVPSTSGTAPGPKSSPTQPAPLIPPTKIPSPTANVEAKATEVVVTTTVHTPPKKEVRRGQAIKPVARTFSPITILPPPEGPPVSAVNVTQTAGRAVKDVIQTGVQNVKKIPSPTNLPPPQRLSNTRIPPPPPSPPPPPPQRLSKTQITPAQPNVSLPQRVSKPQIPPPPPPPTTTRLSKDQIPHPQPKRPSTQPPPPPPPLPPPIQPEESTVTNEDSEASSKI